MALPAPAVAAAMLHLALLGLVFGSLALAIGATFGHAGASRAVPAVIAVVAYVVNGLAPRARRLAGATCSKLSPFYQYASHDPLRNGVVGAGGRRRRRHGRASSWPWQPPASAGATWRAERAPPPMPAKCLDRRPVRRRAALRAQVDGEPVAGQAGNDGERSGLLEQMRRSGHDLQSVRAVQSCLGGRLRSSTSRPARRR